MEGPNGPTLVQQPFKPFPLLDGSLLPPWGSAEAPTSPLAHPPQPSGRSQQRPRRITGAKVSRTAWEDDEADPEFSPDASNSRGRAGGGKRQQFAKGGGGGGPSRHRGVVYHKSNRKYEARIYEGGRQKFLGYYLDEDSAAMAYDDYAVKLHGREARLNFPHRYEHRFGPMAAVQPRDVASRGGGGRGRGARSQRRPARPRPAAAAAAGDAARGNRPLALVGGDSSGPCPWGGLRAALELPLPPQQQQYKQYQGKQYHHLMELEPSSTTPTAAAPAAAAPAAPGADGSGCSSSSLQGPADKDQIDQRGPRPLALAGRQGAEAQPGRGTSRYRGVSWSTACCKWRAQVWKGSEVHHLGYFDREEDAALAYDEAVLRIRGPSATTNFGGPEEPGAHTAGELFSQYPGVSWDSTKGRWAAEIWDGQSNSLLVFFHSEEVAAKAYDMACLAHHGMQARTNFPLASYQAELAAMALCTLGSDAAGAERWNWEAASAETSSRPSSSYGKQAEHAKHTPGSPMPAAASEGTPTGSVPAQLGADASAHSPAAAAAAAGTPYSPAAAANFAAPAYSPAAYSPPAVAGAGNPFAKPTMPEEPGAEVYSQLPPAFVGVGGAAGAARSGSREGHRTAQRAAAPAVHAAPHEGAERVGSGGLEYAGVSRPPSGPESHNGRCRGASPYMGVSFDKRKGKWFAQIQQHGKRHFLGYFDEEAEAGKAYDRAAFKLYGPGAHTNFPPGLPNAAHAAAPAITKRHATQSPQQSPSQDPVRPGACPRMHTVASAAAPPCSPVPPQLHAMPAVLPADQQAQHAEPPPCSQPLAWEPLAQQLPQPQPQGTCRPVQHPLTTEPGMGAEFSQAETLAPGPVPVPAGQQAGPDEPAPTRAWQLVHFLLALLTPQRLEGQQAQQHPAAPAGGPAGTLSWDYYDHAQLQQQEHQIQPLGFSVAALKAPPAPLPASEPSLPPLQRPAVAPAYGRQYQQYHPSPPQFLQWHSQPLYSSSFAPAAGAGDTAAGGWALQYTDPLQPGSETSPESQPSSWQHAQQHMEQQGGQQAAGGVPALSAAPPAAGKMAGKRQWAAAEEAHCGTDPWHTSYQPGHNGFGGWADAKRLKPATY